MLFSGAGALDIFFFFISFLDRGRCRERVWSGSAWVDVVAVVGARFEVAR
jgi:hypothetical protein